MKSRLSESQINYVLEHLGHHASLSDMAALFRFGSDPEPGTTCIYFPLSREEFHTDNVLHINDVPVLYPVKEGAETAYAFQGNNLVFHHDLLKSAFHLLSGYEEIKRVSEDQHGRFPYKESIQRKLGIIRKPVVNYYFEIILDGIGEFGRKNNIPFKRNPVFTNPVLMLSHDIDRIGGYSFFETGFRFKQLVGMADSPLNLKGRILDSFTALFHFLNPFSRKDPFWTFENLNRWASERGFRSTYYFLEKEGGRNMNSRYHFHDKGNRCPPALPEIQGARYGTDPEEGWPGL